MLELTLDGAPRSLVHIQDEPALEFALPRIFDQPVLGSLQRGRVAHVEALAAQIARRQRIAAPAALGPDYQELVTEFQPLFLWATACWDYLLSTEGCRFVPRPSGPRYGIRGDYRVVTDKDYSRIVHGVFRACVMAFAETPMSPTLAQYLREHFWPMTLEAYRRLEQPADPRQRHLTPYSYLRCVPYQFLNDVHQDLVDRALRELPDEEQRALSTYFLQFHTEPAAAAALGCSPEDLRVRLQHGLTALLIRHRLVYCLLRQIERY